VRPSAPSPMTIRAPGWYPDPQDPSIGAERWWSGTEWSERGRHTDDLDRAPVAPPETPLAKAPKRGLRSLFHR
jgi:hypothetical protein